MKEYEIIIIGGGCAGLAAALAAKESGASDILIIERENTLGGILNQCIHSGYGLQFFKEELTGPEYSQRFIDKINELDIEYKLNTNVLHLGSDKKIIAVNGEDGLIEIKAKAVIVASGCREKSTGIVNIPRSNCAGIFTAGSAQKLVNLEGYLPGKEVVIFGAGIIGLYMAERLVLEGAKVIAVIEWLQEIGEKEKTMVESLNYFDVPLILSHTITKIHGEDRVEGITITEVDESRKTIANTERYIPCDTLIISVGLVPENMLLKEAGAELSAATKGPVVDENMQTSVEGIFSCGNVVKIHDIADEVTMESYKAGKRAAEYVKQ